LYSGRRDAWRSTSTYDQREQTYDKDIQPLPRQKEILHYLILLTMWFTTLLLILRRSHRSTSAHRTWAAARRGEVYHVPRILHVTCGCSTLAILKRL
jgi:hypothetical protein